MFLCGKKNYLTLFLVFIESKNFVTIFIFVFFLSNCGRCHDVTWKKNTAFFLLILYAKGKLSVIGSKWHWLLSGSRIPVGQTACYQQS